MYIWAIQGLYGVKENCGVIQGIYTVELKLQQLECRASGFRVQGSGNRLLGRLLLLSDLLSLLLLVLSRE